MKFAKYFLLGIALMLPFSPAAFSQQSFSGKAELAEKVKKEFLHAWNSYRKYAWGHDALKPLSRSFRDWHSESLMMTPVDAFDTMLLMGLKKEAEEAKQLILSGLSFDKDITVQNFEISIRILGGLISAYELDGDKRFLQMAEDLAQRLIKAFNSPTGMPYRMVNLKTGKTSGAESNSAEIGTYIIEYGTLSRLTGKPVYFNTAKKAMAELYKRRSSRGLIGSEINVETGEWLNKESHISGGIDSYYEYLLKAAILFDDKDLKTMWDSSITAINKYLYDEKGGELWYGVSDMNTGERISTTYGALDAFFPAVLSLNGDMEKAEKLQQSGYKMWLLAGIEPEQIDYATMKITSPYYLLRPENIESAYYLYRYTGDYRYITMGEEYLNSIIKYCRTDNGYCALKNVMTGEKMDAMESFFLAETMKYLYLLFAPEETLDFNSYIFNTEAHPVKRNY